MKERGCSYATAYAQMRREKERYAADYMRQYPYLAQNQCYILKRADEIRALISDHAAQEALKPALDPVDEARQNLRQIRLEEFDTQEEKTAAIEEAAKALAKARAEAGL
ncbi:MAG: hypothetical protein ACYDHE_21115 [Candidatus Acidiferrales bacterium]